MLHIQKLLAEKVASIDTSECAELVLSVLYAEHAVA